jgi:archaetidylinositol phosphate synthase
MNDTWSHDAARVLVRPLVGTWVRPNHITLVRLLSGLAACVLLARGEPKAALWSGVFWLISVFLDRADGELARIGQLQSRAGHLFDYYTDTLLNSGFFLAAGIGSTHSWLGPRAVPIGIATCVAMLACAWLSEMYEALTPPDVRVWEGAWGFHPDDALYLLAPLTWLGWLAPTLVAACIVTSMMAVVILVRYLLLKRRLSQQALAQEPV